MQLGRSLVNSRSPCRLLRCQNMHWPSCMTRSWHNRPTLSLGMAVAFRNCIWNFKFARLVSVGDPKGAAKHRYCRSSDSWEEGCKLCAKSVNIVGRHGGKVIKTGKSVKVGPRWVDWNLTRSTQCGPTFYLGMVRSFTGKHFRHSLQESQSSSNPRAGCSLWETKKDRKQNKTMREQLRRKWKKKYIRKGGEKREREKWIEKD